MKIFVTVGFETFPFDRLLQAIHKGLQRRLIRGEVSIQIGHSRCEVPAHESYRFLGFDELVVRIKEADIVISHAGVGTTLLCLTLGKTPILFPRQSRFHEHVDDHQIQFARKMESQGKALVAYDEDDLFDKISHYASFVKRTFRSLAEEKSDSLRSTLEEILAHCAGRKEAS